MKNFTQDELKVKEGQINKELESRGLVTISFLRVEDGKVKFFTNALKGTVSPQEFKEVIDIVSKHFA